MDMCIALHRHGKLMCAFVLFYTDRVNKCGHVYFFAHTG